MAALKRSVEWTGFMFPSLVMSDKWKALTSQGKMNFPQLKNLNQLKILLT